MCGNEENPMIIDDHYYDVIIVGTGAGGGTLAYKLASTGKKILILERGDFMPLEEQNRSNIDIFQRDRYHAPEQWYDHTGEPFSPQTNYAIGGNTKIYGAALLRRREKDFEEVTHQAGISPEWCVKYDEFEPYYTEAENLYKVHGETQTDSTEPNHSAEYPYAAVSHEPEIQKIYEAIANQGLHPSTIPLGLTRQEDDPTSDSEESCLVPALKSANVTLKTQAKVISLHTNPSGRSVKGVEAEVGGQSYLCGLLTDIIFAESPPVFSIVAKLMPNFGLKQLATHSIGWWAQTEDLPDPNNRVRLENNKIHIDYNPNNMEAHDRLIYRWTDVLKNIEKSLDGFRTGFLHPRSESPLQVVANQCGTCRFGDDPLTSVLDRDCRTHDLDNLYVVDGSFFPSNAAVSPALTIIANALRVGDRLIERFK